MPFRSIFFRKDKAVKNLGEPELSEKEKKSLFGLKIVKAQQNPASIYDLSGCSASFLPDDTYTFCRLLGKTILNIKGNNLANLDSGGICQDLSNLEVLDASNNKIDKLPLSISAMKSLKVLILSENLIKSLPDSFAYLKSLEELNLYQNKLSMVPQSICALPRLRVLNLKLNNISNIPSEFCDLQKTLVTFIFDNEKITNLPKVEVIEVENLMKHLCKEANIEYSGLEIPPDETDNSNSNNVSIYNANIETDEILMTYLKKKNERDKVHMLAEEKLQEIERAQLQNVLHNASLSKEQILLNLPDSPSVVAEFEGEKQKKLEAQIRLEESFRNDQSEQLNIYLTNTNDKESLLENLANHENNLQKEFKSIMLSKDEERSSLLKDLVSGEEKTNLALEELLNSQQSVNSEDFTNMLNEQEIEMQRLISGNYDDAVELRQADIMNAMQDSMLKDAQVLAERERIDEKQKSWVSSLINEGAIEESQLNILLEEKSANHENFMTNLLKEEEYQEKAFRILLSDMDMKRNDVIRQIALIEYELVRLSCLDLRKKMHGVQYGSTTMINQRKTAVGLLESLFKAKDIRDNELNSLVDEMAHRRCDNTEDFWLLQYQSLMNLKPPGLAEAEDNLDPKVTTILTMANVLHLITLFAKLEITYEILLDMSEDDYSKLNIGYATYHSIQRALHNYLATTKLNIESSCPAGDDFIPSAPPSLGAAASIETDEASAPPLEKSYLESECVICMNNECKVIFIPCGHICICSECCTNIELCPICRSVITKKFSVFAH